MGGVLERCYSHGGSGAETLISPVWIFRKSIILREVPDILRDGFSWKAVWNSGVKVSIPSFGTLTIFSF